MGTDFSPWSPKPSRSLRILSRYHGVSSCPALMRSSLADEAVCAQQAPAYLRMGFRRDLHATSLFSTAFLLLYYYEARSVSSRDRSPLCRSVSDAGHLLAKVSHCESAGAGALNLSKLGTSFGEGPGRRTGLCGLRPRLS